MATIIDSLLVTLGLDASAFKKGSKEVEKAQNDLDKDFKRSSKERDLAEKKAADAQKKRAKEVEQYGKKTAETFSKIRNQALGLAAVFTAGMGIVAFTRDTIGSVAALGRLSTMTGVSVNKLAAFGLAFKQIGGNTQEANAAMLKMSNDIESFKAGMPNADVTGFLRFGGKASALKDTQSYMNGLAELLSKIDKRKGTQYAWVAAQQMGVSYNEFQLLRQGPQALDRLIAKNEKLTGITAKSAAAAQAMQQKWADLMESLQQTGRTILFTLAPALQEALGYMQKLASWAIAHKATIRQWVDEAVKSVQKFVDMANKGAEAVGGWKNVLIALVALKVASIVSPLLSVAAALMSIGKALGFIGGAGAAGGMGVLAKLTTAGFLSAIALEVAKLLGLPDTNKAKGQADIDRGDWWKASFDMPAQDFISQGWKAITGKLEPRGIRNNNPGNIRYGDFAKRHGATGADAGGFAIFPSMAKGEAAAQALLGGYMNRGDNTIRKIVSRWAPSSENDTNAYINAVSRMTGLSPDGTLSAANIPAISQAMFRQENGSKAWAQYARTMPTGAAAGRWHVAGNSVASNTNISTTIGQITVNTQATDAQGIAKSIGPALRSGSDLLAMQGNTGMN